MKQKKALKILSALAQETRINIYKLLIKESKEGISAGVIAEILNVPAATLSFHLTQMVNAELLKSHKKGRAVMYSAKRKAIKNLATFLMENSHKEHKKKEETLQDSKHVISDDE